MRNIYLFLLLVVSCLSAKSQQVNSMQLDLEMNKAKLTFDIKKYKTAAGLYKKLYGKIRDEALQNDMLYMVAESYRRANNFKQAYEWYDKLVNTKYPDVRIIYSYGLLLKNFERYEEANRQFGDYLFEVPGDKNALREIKACAEAQMWKANPKRFTVKEVAALNTEFSDYSPFYVKGNLIWSSSRNEATGNEIFEWTGQKCSDFFTASPSGNSWSKPGNLKGGINTNFNEGAGWMDSTGSVFYFTQCNGTDGKGMNCKIYVSYKENETWVTPRPLPFCSDSFSVGHPAMSADGKRLFFASDMPGGFGEKDIYYIPYNNLKDTWGTPVNLGERANTNEDDMFPHAATDGSIYFASKGWPGMGGLDLYKTQDSAGTFKQAQNLQSPINSGGDDFGISFVPTAEINKDEDAIAYFCSNRQGGKGDDDIYAITNKPFIFKVIGKVLDKESGLPLPLATITLMDSSNNTLFSIKSTENGAFTAELPLKLISFIHAQKDKYFSSAAIQLNPVGLTKDSTVEVSFSLDAIPTEEYEFTLNGIYYDVDKADIRPDAAKVLDSLVIILTQNPGISIELGSHTDSRAAEDYNLKLSQKRAQSCVDYLTKKGIAKDRLTAVGYGETRLVNDCADGVDCTEEQHQENRRTTFRVLSTDYKKKR
jgi:outer membrane protein OmpA-like peptidoglycan-associated protein/tetratricopeptide (TPR) repeat protein